MPLWTIRGGTAFRPAPFLVAGILNLTPDSFSDGGCWVEHSTALDHAQTLWRDGAHMLDLGAESTRPGSDAVSGDEEIARLTPVLRRILDEREGWGERNGLPFPPVSVDTWRAKTAERVLDMGVEIINDISGGSFDPAMDDVVASYAPGYVLMHCPAPPKTMQDAPSYAGVPGSATGGVTGAVLDFFTERMEALVRAGLPESRIILDPGIGFGKNLAHNLELLRNTERLASLGRPLYYGISRKRFLGELLGLATPDRDGPTHVLSALLAAKGVLVHRVHEVAGCAHALALAAALRGADTTVMC